MLSVQFCSSCITVQKSVLVRGNVGAASGSVVLRGVVSGGKWASFLLLLMQRCLGSQPIRVHAQAIPDNTI